MSSGYQAVIHVHCAAEECELSFIKAKYDESKKLYVDASYLKSNMKAIVRIKVSLSIVDLRINCISLDLQESLY